MILQLFIGGIMIGLTVCFHALSLDLLIKNLKHIEGLIFGNLKSFRKALFFTFVVLCVAIILVVELWAWAMLYYGLGAFATIEHSLYFSIESFTTVGFGDAGLPQEWRLLGVIEATNGFLIFGWSTAFIFEIVSSVYKRESKDLSN
ncbi:MAG: ion channel [Pseudobdellovibrionaceae bacterium]